jgi:hypothetical protein
LEVSKHRATCIFDFAVVRFGVELLELIVFGEQESSKNNIAYIPIDNFVIVCLFYIFGKLAILVLPVFKR